MASAYATTRYYKQIKMKFKFIFYNQTPYSLPIVMCVGKCQTTFMWFSWQYNLI